MQSNDPADDRPDPLEGDLPLSRSQRKRDAGEVANLARRLIDLAPERQDALALDDELREALEAARGLSRSALNRQRKRVAKLLRAQDHAAIVAALARGQLPESAAVEADPASTRWRDRIIEGEDEELQSFLIEYPSGDRQQLRQLARSARQHPESRRSRRANRELLNAISEAIGPLVSG